MELIKKKINKKDITGDGINFYLFLTEEYNSLGYMTDYSSDLTIENTVNIVTGITSNKLNNIRSYDYNNLYKVGINGVTELTDTYIKYTINDIDYITYLTDNTTFFTSKIESYNYINNNFIFDEANINYTDISVIDNSVNIERQKLSVVENISKLRQITSVIEITNFNNGFYSVYDQTI